MANDLASRRDDFRPLTSKVMCVSPCSDELEKQSLCQLARLAESGTYARGGHQATTRGGYPHSGRWGSPLYSEPFASEESYG